MKYRLIYCNDKHLFTTDIQPKIATDLNRNFPLYEVASMRIQTTFSDFMVECLGLNSPPQTKLPFVEAQIKDTCH